LHISIYNIINTKKIGVIGGDILRESVEIFKALSDENRITIFKLLTCGELCVCDILENLNLSQSTVSHHLKVLYQAGLIHAGCCE
jgi:ArsR family transcriptional regulator